MRPTTTNETAVKSLRDGIAALETLQASTARIESERGRLLDQHDGSLNEKFLVRYASIEGGATAAKELEVIMANRLAQAAETGRQVENYGISDIRSFHSAIDDAIEAHVLAATPEDIREAVNVWASKTSLDERKARPSFFATTIATGQNVRISEIIGGASGLAESLTQLSIEHKRCIAVAKRYGAKLEQAA